MKPFQQIHRPHSAVTLRDRTFLHGLAGWLMAIAAFLCLGLSTVRAQESKLRPGDAVVTGFSGYKPPEGVLALGANPLEEFFIDPDGASVQIFSLTAPGLPEGKLSPLPATLRIPAKQVGQVFAIALDDGLGQQIPNIYLGATSAYGLHIVTPDSDGDGRPERVKTGKPNAKWMEGLFATDRGGTADSIWKVDGRSGEVALFATLPDNTGPGVGDVVFDAKHKQFFASDLDRGLIYRIDRKGAVIDNFDHGVDGRPAKGLAAVPDDGSKLDITNATFDSEKPETWGYTQKERMVYGMVVHNGRLYYAVKDGLQVWSIGIAEDGSFAGDPRWAFDAKELAGTGPITDMVFDADGRLTQAQRGEPRGSFDYSLFAEAEKSSVARYRLEEPDDPATPSIRVQVPEDYSIGMPPDHRHADGGVALGFGYTAEGVVDSKAREKTLWTTGHRLLPSDTSSPAVAAEIDVHGLQGNDASLVRPENTPPKASYFIDYDNFFGDHQKAGHMGDVEIWQPAAGAAPDFGAITPSPGGLPPGYVVPEQIPIPPFTPGPEFASNLTVRKVPFACIAWNGGYSCPFEIRVTNTGPDPYGGPIQLHEWVPGAPAGAILGVSPHWTCSGSGTDAHCWLSGVTLLPGDSVTLYAVVWVPGTYPHCAVQNAVAIEVAPGGTSWNTDPTDDFAVATAALPAGHCSPPAQPAETNLTIKKDPLSCATLGGTGEISCAFEVTVTNAGPGVYTGDIEVQETAPDGTTLGLVGAAAAGWSCFSFGGSPAYNCILAAGPPLNPTESRTFIVQVIASKERAKELGCSIENRVQIVRAPGGTPQNTNAGDDLATATATIPGDICQEKQAELSIKKEPVDCSMAGDVVQCVWKIIVSNAGPGDFDGDISFRDTASIDVRTWAWTAGSGWTCTASGSTAALCSRGGARIAAGSSIELDLKTDFDIAALQGAGCKVENRVQIVSPAAGSPGNATADDDFALASTTPPMCALPISCPPGYDLQGNGCVPRREHAQGRRQARPT